MGPAGIQTASAQAQIEALANQRFVEAFLLQSSRSQLLLIPVVCLVGAMWMQSTGGAWPLVWAGLASVFFLWRAMFTGRLVLRFAPGRRIRPIAALLFFSGTVQALPLLEFSALSDEARGVLTMILMTTAAVSVMTTSGFRSIFMAFTVPMLLPLAWAWFAHGWSDGRFTVAALGLMILMNQAFLYSIGRHASARFMEACTYRFGEQQLNMELKAALAEADEANRAKTQFLAAASHDLRQPIHSMNVLVAALSMRPLDAKTAEVVGLLSSVNQVLSRQLDTLLDISKLDAGIVRVEPVPCRLDEIARLHAAALAPLARQEGLTVEVVAGEEIWVRSDAALLTRALSNLTDNAMKYTPDGGRVRLHVLREMATGLLRVEDTGIGIPEGELERVFREFYQVGNSERDRSKGLGLGLSIVRRLCLLLGAGVHLESSLGRGTSVTLSLPLSAPAVLPQGGAGRSGEAQPVRAGIRVLVVDDEAMVRDSMRLLLQGMQCEIHTADGVDKAREVAAGHALDLVLSDLRLRDGETGLLAVEAVRAHQPGLPAVLITGDTAPDRIREAQEAGLALLFKPVTFDDLVSALRIAQANPATRSMSSEQRR